MQLVFVSASCPVVGWHDYGREWDLYKTIKDLVKHGCVSESSSYLQQVPL